MPILKGYKMAYSPITPNILMAMDDTGIKFDTIKLRLLNENDLAIQHF